MSAVVLLYCGDLSSLELCFIKTHSLYGSVLELDNKETCRQNEAVTTALFLFHR